MTRYLSMYCRAVVLAATATTSYGSTTNKTLLIVGDSMAEFSGTLFESFCPGLTVKNAGIGGATADGWTGNVLNAIGSSTCGGASPDYIWISLGGNDNFATECGSTADVLAAKITAAIDRIKAAAPAAQIFMTGYCMSMSAEASRRLAWETSNASTERRLACNAPAMFQNLSDAIKNATDADSNVTFFDATERCDGNSASWSASKYFQDPVHLNSRGYCRVFTMPALQSFLSCPAVSYDCDSWNCSIPGLANQCAGTGTITSCANCNRYCNDTAPFGTVPLPSPTPSPTPVSTQGSVDTAGLAHSWMLTIPVAVLSFLRSL